MIGNKDKFGLVFVGVSGRQDRQDRIGERKHRIDCILKRELRNKIEHKTISAIVLSYIHSALDLPTASMSSSHVTYSSLMVSV